MPSQNGNGSRGSGATPGSEIEDLLREGQDWLRQIMQSGGPRGVIPLAVLALAGRGAWTAFSAIHTLSWERRPAVCSDRGSSRAEAVDSIDGARLNRNGGFLRAGNRDLAAKRF
jgi:hypothetical protein